MYAIPTHDTHGTRACACVVDADGETDRRPPARAHAVVVVVSTHILVVAKHI
jgi:hypothetical protein